jgi:hypothetical protein
MKVVSFIICDDIRREIGGKHTLVGVYDDLNFLIPVGKTVTWPMTIKLAFFCRLLIEKTILDADKYEFYLSQDDQQIACLSENIALPSKIQLENINLALVINSLQIIKPGNIDFKLRFLKNKAIIEELSFDSLKVNVIIQQPPKVA